jgi:hypothetical protein
LKLRRLSPALALAVPACALAIAGCGSSANPSSSASSSKESKGLQFANCMRSHGVPSFPDPGADGTLSVGGSSGIDLSSPAFQSAQQACARLLGLGSGSHGSIPESRKLQLLAMSRCMREHGLPNFPDPNFSGGGARLSIGPNTGLDPASPAFQHAAAACGLPHPKPGQRGPTAVFKP